MQVTKYETNLKRKLKFNKTSNISFKNDSKNEENKLINVYPSIYTSSGSQSFIGFGRSAYTVLLAITFQNAQMK